MKNIILLLILLIPFVIGAEYELEEGGVDYEIYTVEYCVGEINVLPIAKKPLDNNTYQIKNCKLVEDEWFCPCNNPFNITITTIKEMENEFDFKIYYYVEEILASTGSGEDTDAIPIEGKPTEAEMKKADAFRKKEINNFKIGPVKEDRPLVFPSISEAGKMILVIFAIVLLLVLVGGGFWLFYKLVWSKEDIGMTYTEELALQEKKKNEKKAKEKKQNMINNVDKDIDNIMEEEKKLKQKKAISNDDVDKFLEDD